MKLSKKRLQELASINLPELDQPQQIKQVKLTKQMWDKLPFDTRANLLLSAVKDPDDVEQYVDMVWEELPSEVTQNMVIYVKA